MHAINETSRIDFSELEHGRLQVRMETNRLYMRSLVPEDAEVCLSLGEEPNFKTEEEKTKAIRVMEGQIQSLWSHCWEKHDPLSAYLIFKTRTETCIGQVQFQRINQLGNVSLGILSQIKFWRKGYAAEIIRAIVYDFIPIINAKYFPVGRPINRLSVTLHPYNSLCRTVYESIGFQLQGAQTQSGVIRYYYEMEVPKKDALQHLVIAGHPGIP